MNKQHKLVRLFLGPVFALCLIPVLSNAATVKLDANDSLTATGAWQNVANCYADDGLYTVGTGLANGTCYFRVGLADPADTMNQRITSVILYTKGFSNNARAKVRLIPCFAGVAGISSGSYTFGVTEVLRSFDITGQRVPWAWSDIVNLSVQFTPRTAATFSVNHIFAMVTSVDTMAAAESHYFVFDAIASPETLGLYFPVVIRAMTTPGDTVMSSYNNTAGLCSVQVMIAQDTVNTALLVSDGDTSGASNQFDVINPGLHHFGFGPIGPQTVGLPFPVTISALDFYGDTATTFGDKVDLWDLSGALTPDSSGVFSGGLWTGSLTISAAISSDTLYCSRTIGGRTYAGASNGFAVPTGISGDKPVIPPIKSFGLDISPNPTSGRTQILLAMPKSGKVVLILYNVLGQEVARKELGLLPSGTNKIDWALGSAQLQGLYFLRAMVDDQAAAMKKLLILR